MHIKPHILWLKMKYWQWRSGGPAPDEKVDMLLLRYGTEHKRLYDTMNSTIREDFATEEEFLRELARRHIAARQHFLQFVEGFKRTATTPESKALYAEVRWILETQVSSWGYTLEDVRERRVWRHTNGPEISRLGLEARVKFGLAPWYEHISYWYNRLTGKYN